MPNTPASQELWNQLDGFENSDGLWASVAHISIAGGSLGYAHFKIGLTIEGGNPKWMELETSTEASEQECEDTGEETFEAGETLTPTFFETPHAPITGYYLTCIGEMDEEFSQGPCGSKWVKPDSGWSDFKWDWNLCYIGHEEYVPIYARGYYRPFHYARPQEWDHQVLSGEGTMNASTGEGSDPGTTVTKERLKAALESDKLLNAWLKYQLFKEERNPTQIGPPTEEYGPENPGKPDQSSCFTADPVNCATGNHVEMQNDLSVGGRGLGLSWTRTYNSQLRGKPEYARPAWVWVDLLV